MDNTFSQATGAPLNNSVMDKDDAPVGFKMTLAQNINALSTFTALPKSQQQALVEGARQVSNPQDMQAYVERIVQG